jgi:hypothetical protein
VLCATLLCSYLASTLAPATVDLMALVPDKCGCACLRARACLRRARIRHLRCRKPSDDTRSLRTHADADVLPRRTVPRVWNVFTAGYFETNAFAACFNCAALLFLGRRIEPVWGARVRRRSPFSAHAYALHDAHHTTAHAPRPFHARAQEFIHFTTVVNLSVGTSTFFVMCAPHKTHKHTHAR